MRAPILIALIVIITISVCNAISFQDLVKLQTQQQQQSQPRHEQPHSAFEQVYEEVKDLASSEVEQLEESIFERLHPSSSAASLSNPMQVCPTLSNIDPTNPQPPTNYTFYLKPVLKPTGNYTSWYMIDVIHSNNPAWINGHILCKYANCAQYSCPTITLVSDQTFTLPISPIGYWGVYTRINHTLICNPIDHDVDHCMFS